MRLVAALTMKNSKRIFWACVVAFLALMAFICYDIASHTTSPFHRAHDAPSK